MSETRASVPGALLAKGVPPESVPPAEAQGDRGTPGRAPARSGARGDGPSGRALVKGRAAPPDPIDARTARHGASGHERRDGAAPPDAAGSTADLLVDRPDEARIAIDVRGVDLLFGPAGARRAALEALDAGCDRETILARTGVVLGVADATLAVPAGSLSVLMGLSGSGKSSLLRCVNALNPLTRGSLTVRSGGRSVELAGLRGKELRDLRRRGLAMVFQQFALLPWATVRENVAFGLEVRGESAAETRRIVDEQLALVHLEPWADKRIDQLSGGMQQRVGLARAFATDADILLMDEPFSALDPLIREHLQDELLDLQRRLGKTILFVSHDLDEALKLGDRISLMEEGRIVQSGTPREIVFTPATDYVRRFVAGINPLSVLTAATVMRPVASERESLSLPERQGELKLVGGRPIVLLAGVEPLPLVRFDGGEPVPPSAVAAVAENLPVRELVRQASASPRPVLVTGEGGRLSGMVLAADILAALAARLGDA